jgi:hypothetical protein
LKSAKRVGGNVHPFDVMHGRGTHSSIFRDFGAAQPAIRTKNIGFMGTFSPVNICFT